MPRGRSRKEDPVEAGTGLEAVIEGVTDSVAPPSLADAIQADEGAEEGLQEPPVTEPFEDDEEYEEKKRERGKYWVNGGMGQVQLFTFPLDPIVFWAVDAYTAARIRREAALPPSERGPSFASATYQERVARMVAECIGKCIGDDFDRDPEERMFDWGASMTLPLDLVVREMVDKRWRSTRGLFKESVKVRLRQRFPDLSEREIQELVGMEVGE